MAWYVEETGREPVACAELSDARQYVEDRAVELWEATRDPNSSDRQPYEGVQWWVDSTKPGVMVATWRRTEWRVQRTGNVVFGGI